jgi:hypothetical protein
MLFVPLHNLTGVSCNPLTKICSQVLWQQDPISLGPVSNEPEYSEAWRWYEVFAIAVFTTYVS